MKVFQAGEAEMPLPFFLRAWKPGQGRKRPGAPEGAGPLETPGGTLRQHRGTTKAASG
ncbi:hypothetical protein [Prosthecobacter fluviatilis]|uniref:Uncharacterized protein n=1 Tax=Prosthecobacter fluviatilis TaxID=445931 RepID=A0ABW0KVQ9_9BACT